MAGDALALAPADTTFTKIAQWPSASSWVSVNRQGSLEGALGHAVGGEHNLLDGVAGG